MHLYFCKIYRSFYTWMPNLANILGVHSIHLQIIHVHKFLWERKCQTFSICKSIYQNSCIPVGRLWLIWLDIYPCTLWLLIRTDLDHGHIISLYYLCTHTRLKYSSDTFFFIIIIAGVGWSWYKTSWMISTNILDGHGIISRVYIYISEIGLSPKRSDSMNYQEYQM